MTMWKRTVVLADFWRDDTKTFTEKRDLTVQRLKSSGWRAMTSDEALFDEIVDNYLAVAGGVEGFDAALSDLYDLADYDRVWIDTRSKVIRL